MNEEIQLKVGVATDGLDSGLRTLRQKVDTASAGIQASLTKASSGVKDFKKFIAEAGDVVPGLGIALKAAFSPVGAAIAGATLAVGYFRDKLAATNAELDRQGDAAAEPLGNFAHAADRAKLKIAEFERTYKNMLQDLGKSNDDLLDGLNKQLAVLQSQANVNKTILQQVKDRATAEIQSKMGSGKLTTEQAATATKKTEQNFASAQKVLDYKNLQAEQAARQQTREALQKKMAKSAFDLQTIKGEDINSPEAAKRLELYDEQIGKLEAAEKAAKERLATAQSKAEGPSQTLTGREDPEAAFIIERNAANHARARAEVDSASAALSTVQGVLKTVKNRKIGDTELLRANRERLGKADAEAMGAKGQLKTVDDQLFGGGLKLHEQLMGMSPQERVAALAKKDTSWNAQMKQKSTDWNKKMYDEQESWRQRTPGYTPVSYADAVKNANYQGGSAKRDDQTAQDILKAMNTMNEALSRSGIIVKSIANGP